MNPPTGALGRVGSESPKGDGKWGQADLGGNVFEWTLDWNATPYVNPCDDCANLTPSTNRVVRGGYFINGASRLRGAFRFNISPALHAEDFGVRCARTP